MMSHVPENAAWHRLDNAGRVFAAIASRRNTTVFRVAVTLRKPVDRAELQRALSAVMPRFPYFCVRLRSGLFWHSFTEVRGVPRVQTERRAPCRRITRRGDGPWQFRVLIRDRRIAVEFSHVLSDGFGALVFLNTLLGEYLARRGVVIPDDGRILRPDTIRHPEEEEDAYRRFYEAGIPPPPSNPRALRLRAARLAPDDCKVILGVVPIEPLRAMRREYGVTLTELLLSILLASIADITRGVRRPIAVMTPVDLRRLFPSRTMRNFFLSVSASIDPRLGSYTFEEIIHDVHHSVQGQISAKSINRQVRRNVGAERNLFIRRIPLFLKVPLKRSLYRWRWGARYTTALSNLGRVELPPSISAQVERYEALPNPSAAHGIGCGIVGHGDELSITFTSIVSGTGIERAFFTRLRRMGITARIESN